MIITVGEGGYGKVVKVKNKADPDKVFAAKKVNLVKRDVKTSVKKELEILQKLDSPHVIKFVEYFEDPKVAVWYKMSAGITSAPCQSCILVTEYLDGGELFERVVEDDLTEADCCAFIAQVAIQYLFYTSIHTKMF